jgi:ssRNA-specific RNase YbeY (16S rRNA maturation enzyme)
MKINVYTTGKQRMVKGSRVRQLVKKVLRTEGKNFTTVNVILGDDHYLEQLNAMYFRKKVATNVISFNLDDVAEIYVSQNRARDADELYYYIVHGLLHTIGYDHRNRRETMLMEAKCLGYISDDTFYS